MRIQRATPVNEFLAKLIFLILPTSAAGYFLLHNLNEQYAILQNQSVQQSIYLAAGMGLASFFYSFRLRFLPTFAALIALMFVAYKGLDSYSSSEFDTFFITVRFQVFAVLFSTGWLVGWGFTRLRYFAVFLSVAILAFCIATIATMKVDTVQALLRAFLPAVVYAVYVIFAAEQIYNYKDKSKMFWWYLVRRTAIFGMLAAVLLGGVVFLMRRELKQTVAQYGGQGKQGQNSMTKQNKDGTFDLLDYIRLNPSLSRSNSLLFCAHIDNYFPGTDIPNPLYLTEYYFTKFDAGTETFEPDKNVPFKDLFEPDPSKIPLFSTKMDTTVIRNSLGDSLRNIVDVEIYNVNLSPSAYLAPNVGYFVQPVTIEKDFREKFRSAYRTKSYVSLLNSAYFIYNIDTPWLRQFQAERFKILRKVTSYGKVDSQFMRYYTQMPPNDKFRSITELTHKVTDTAKTPIDKVLAIRNYFLSKDENGDHLYKYTDNPGEPDIPNASKLLYFLNENHKGYCAYYAGATLFMLRSIGIPSRIAVGFLTEERSDKNKGWYWYYANQAHAWVQVYFPGFGWLDFDTTVGNREDDRPTPQPDGTPPMQPPKAWLAAEGIVERTDTLKKLMDIKVKRFVFHDKEYQLKEPVSMTVDMKVAVVYRDSVAMPLAKVKTGDEGTAVSYAEALKKMDEKQGESAEALVKRMAVPVPIDEVYLKSKDKAKTEEKKAATTEKKEEQSSPWFWIAIAGLFVLFVLQIPKLVLWYYMWRHRQSTGDADKSYWAFRAATYYLHMVGVTKGTRTPMQYARQLVDPLFGTDFTGFMNVYLKKKYAKQELNERERQLVHSFLSPFMAAVKSNIGFGVRFFAFHNPGRTISFFSMPEDGDEGEDN